MTRNKRIRAWRLISVFGCIVFAACARSTNEPGNQSTTSEIFSSAPPFKTLEPDRYQAVRTFEFTNSSGASQISRTLIARDGNSRRDEVLEPDGRRSVYLHLPQGNFILIPDSLVYSATDQVNESLNDLSDALSLEDPPEPSLHKGSSEAVYRHLDQENLNGRLTQKYQVVVNNTPSANVSNTETFVWVDEKLGMPIKTETKSDSGNRTVIELTEISNNVDKGLFQIPENYRKVKLDEIRNLLSRK